MHQSRRGLVITDLLGIAAMLILIAAVGVPTLERARELSKRMVCAVNLKALGGAGNVYADANKGEWMIPAHKKKQDPGEGLKYLCTNANGDSMTTEVCVGFLRDTESKSETDNDPAAGSPAVSVTRAYWMLVRSGEISVKQFICPSSQSDLPDPTELIDLYYDFQNYRNISYGYLVPFGPRDTRPRSGADSRLVFAADKGPFYLNVNLDFMTSGPGYNTPIEESHAPSLWQRFNSPNHGLWNGEGQNALHADGRVEFHRKPIAGVDSDNMYTLMRDEWGVQTYGRTHGDSPHQSSAVNPYPGKEAFGQGTSTYSTTDSLIYP